MKKILVGWLLALMALPAFAQITILEPWVRATVSQQTVTGAFMRIRSSTDARLISASSPIAGVSELHRMSLENNVMKMRAIPGIEITGGKGAELTPGGFHIMLMDLKRPIKDGEHVPITLVFEDKTGKRTTINVTAAARPITATRDGSGAPHKH